MSKNRGIKGLLGWYNGGANKNLWRMIEYEKETHFSYIRYE